MNGVKNGKSCKNWKIDVEMRSQSEERLCKSHKKASGDVIVTNTRCWQMWKKKNKTSLL